MAIFTGLLFASTVALWWATERTIKHARESSEQQLRAYVFPHNILLIEGSLANPPNVAFIDKPAVQITVKNSGQTPAYKLIHWAELRVIECRDEDKTLIAPPLEDNNRAAIPSGGEIIKNLQLPRVLSPVERDGIIAGTHGIYVHGVIDYVDTYGNKRWTKYRAKYPAIWPPNPAATFLYGDRGNTSESGAD